MTRPSCEEDPCSEGIWTKCKCSPANQETKKLIINIKNRFSEFNLETVIKMAHNLRSPGLSELDCIGISNKP